MSVQRRLAALERRFPAEPQRPAPEFVPLPPLAEFGAMPPGRQTHVLLGWEPVLDPAVTLPWPENLDAMTEDEWRRLSDALGRVGREILAPYVECLPLDQRVALAREATRTLPASQIWRVQAFRFACRAPWRRGLEAGPDGPQATTAPEGRRP